MVKTRFAETGTVGKQIVLVLLWDSANHARLPPWPSKRSRSSPTVHDHSPIRRKRWLAL